MISRDQMKPPDTGCRQCFAYYAEYQRAALLLERLAEDRFTDQAAFDAWIAKQMTQAFRSSE